MPDPAVKLCSIPECKKEVECRGWCPAHYQKWRKYGDPLATRPWSMGERTVTPVMERFWRKVTLEGAWPRDLSLGRCYEWTAATREGYGVFHPVKGKTVAAHRFILENDLKRPLLPGMFACHRCDNRACVRRSHLYEGTPQDNVRDMVERGRQKRGANDSGAKLLDPQVVAIRERAAAGEKNRDLAAEYGVQESTISLIVKGKRWAHLGGPRTHKYRTRAVLAGLEGDQQEAS